MSGTSFAPLGPAYVVAIWAIRLVMMVVLPLRRSPQAAASLLLLIIFLPIPGLILFLAIGRTAFPKWRVERFARLAPFFAAIGARMKEDRPPASQGPPEVEDLTAALGGFPAVGGNTIEFLDDYDGIITDFGRKSVIKGWVNERPRTINRRSKAVSPFSIRITVTAAGGPPQIRTGL